MNALVPRADRLSLQIPITYRTQGDEDWFQSRVLNLSESGVLFGPTDLREGTMVEVIFSPHVVVGEKPAGLQMCAGKVVRTTELGGAATRFEAWRFLLES